MAKNQEELKPAEPHQPSQQTLSVDAMAAAIAAASRKKRQTLMDVSKSVERKHIKGRVKALRQGYYKNRRIPEGTVFEYSGPEASWIQPVKEQAPVAKDDADEALD